MVDLRNGACLLSVQPRVVKECKKDGGSAFNHHRNSMDLTARNRDLGNIWKRGNVIHSHVQWTVGTPLGHNGHTAAQLVIEGS